MDLPVSASIVLKRRRLDCYVITCTREQDPLVPRRFLAFSERLFGNRIVARTLRAVDERSVNPAHLWRNLLETFHVTVAVKADGTTERARSGPVLFVANHPTGLPDAVILSYAVQTWLRHDFRLLVADSFSHLPFLKGWSIPVYLPGALGNIRRGGARRNRTSMAAAGAFLQRGGAVIAFPAGPDARRRADGSYVDGDWKQAVFDLAVAAGATVVPVYLDAPMSGLRRRLLRFNTALYHAAVTQEVLAIRGKSVSALFGPALDTATVAAIAKEQDIATYVRRLTYQLPEIPGEAPPAPDRPARATAA